MKTFTPQDHQRILIIDDNRAILNDFRKILGEPSSADFELQEAEAELFGTRRSVWFEIDTASQGDEGLKMVQKANAAGRPYAMAFVDVRMPPGIDGIETTQRIWQFCPDLQIVICTAYADCSWSEMQERIRPMDRLLILKKPFDTIEVLQLANALTEKWRLLQESRTKMVDLDQMVKKRTLELEMSQLAAVNIMKEAVINREKTERAYEEFTREVRERRQLEQQFQEQASLLDKARDAIVVRDLEHRITYWNKSAERIYGWSEKEVLGASLPELLYKDQGDFLSACDHLLEHGDWVGELQQTSKDGTSLIVESRWTLVLSAAGERQSILEINTDISDQKKLEQQFLRAQRMESIGTLAGGIAHDLNNVLTPITMSIDLLKMIVPEQRGQEMLAIIAKSASRGADLVRQVLTFARGMEGRRVEVQVGELIQDIDKIARDTFPKNIEIRTAVSPHLWALQGDSTQLHQVLLNLCVNARDAQPDGGTITLRAENAHLDEHFAAVNLEAKAGCYILIQVEDAGVGIPAAIIDSIFDPFFTTKEVGKGTGLGLSTSLAIVKSHGGFMRVFSEPENGTRFQVYLPAQTEPLPQNRVAGQTGSLRGHGETVLLVDDEEPIRQIAKCTLESYGYQVILAQNGAQALDLYAQHREKIALVLTDMMMPVMDGAAMIEALLAMNPGILTIAASGITSSESVTKVMKLGVKEFLPKPFTAQTLTKAVKEVLAKGHAVNQ